VILVDTSVWADHLRDGDSSLVGLLQRAEVLCHPWVIGELALGQLSKREEILGLLAGLPQATLATENEVLAVIDLHKLHGRGIGYVDVQLLASTLLTPEARLWTRDKRLAAAALDLGQAGTPVQLTEPVGPM
jgi:predicted nucleic acid-binding protein